MGINEAYGGISLFPISCKYHFMRSGMAAYERNCVDAKVAPTLNRPKKKKHFKGLLAGAKKEEAIIYFKYNI